MVKSDVLRSRSFISHLLSKFNRSPIIDILSLPHVSYLVEVGGGGRGACEP